MQVSLKETTHGPILNPILFDHSVKIMSSATRTDVQLSGAD